MKKKFFLSFTISLIAFSSIFLVLHKMNFTVNSNNFEEANILEKPDNQKTVGESNRLKEKNEILFLLAGVDSIDTTEKGTRTDTLMLFNVNFESGEISILSIPRDTRALINNRTRKINSAHALGGMPLTISTINDFLELNIEYYVKVDYQVVMDIVDLIGGVEIEVPFLMEYRDPSSDPPLNIYIEEGLQLLDGKNAHDFLRWRKNNSLTVQYLEGDVGRIKTQQYFLTELIKQTLNSKELIKNLPSLVVTYFKNVETNLPLTRIIEAVKLAKNLDTNNIITETLPGEGEYIGEISYFILNEEKAKDLVNKLYK